MSRTARQAAKANGLANGLAKVDWYGVVSHYNMLTEEDDPNVVVMRAYAKGGKMVSITSGDIFYFSNCDDAPMARVS